LREKGRSFFDRMTGTAGGTGRDFRSAHALSDYGVKSKINTIGGKEDERS
jgi:hypothetical protein